MNNKKLETAVLERTGEVVQASVLLLPGGANAAGERFLASFGLLTVAGSEVTIWKLGSASFWGGHALDTAQLCRPLQLVTRGEGKKGWPCELTVHFTDGEILSLNAPRFQWENIQRLLALISGPFAAVRPPPLPPTELSGSDAEQREVEAWLKAKQQVAEQKRREAYEAAREQQKAHRLAQVDKVLATIRQDHSWDFVKVYEAPPTNDPQTERVEVEGLVIEHNIILSGKMDGADDFTAFTVFSPGPQFSMWRAEVPGVEVGHRVRIVAQTPKRAEWEEDHMSDRLLEVWQAK